MFWNRGVLLFLFPGGMRRLQLLRQLPGGKDNTNLFISENVSFNLKSWDSPTPASGIAPHKRTHRYQQEERTQGPGGCIFTKPLAEHQKAARGVGKSLLTTFTSFCTLLMKTSEGGGGWEWKHV